MIHGALQRDRTPILVGFGTVTRHEEDYRRALEPMDLMLEAVTKAGIDTGTPQILRGTQYIGVPQGRWRYRNPAGEIARSIGAHAANTVLTSVGVLQQTLIGEACASISRGERDTTLVVGADAGYRLLRAQIAGAALTDRQQHDDPDIVLAPAEELRHPVELRAGMKMPVGLYAIIDSALRARSGLTLTEHRDRLADLGEQFSQIAAANPHAWQRQPLTAAQIRDASDRNPMQAFPYTRAHCSTWNVDQAAALLFCSVARAQDLGINPAKWIYPVASTESNHMVAVTARADLTTCRGAEVAGKAALEAGDLTSRQLDLVDLYSCFPVAVQQYAEALDLPLTGDLTVTGGMPFAGGPYNNYVLQATCRIAELLREGRGRNALVSCVSGVLTKQAYGLWSMDPAPHGFVHADVTGEVARQVRALDVLADYSGEATVAGYTVLHGRDQKPRGVAVLDTPRGQRALCTCEDEEFVMRMQEEDFVKRTMRIENNRLLPP
jgi:acetyl-CoA C-acetyltransferase